MKLTKNKLILSPKTFILDSIRPVLDLHWYCQKASTIDWVIRKDCSRISKLYSVIVCHISLRSRVNNGIVTKSIESVYFDHDLDL